MKVLVSWLSDYIETGLSVEEIAEILSDLGLPNEWIEYLPFDSDQDRGGDNEQQGRLLRLYRSCEGAGCGDGKRIKDAGCSMLNNRRLLVPSGGIQPVGGEQVEVVDVYTGIQYVFQHQYRNSYFCSTLP